MKLLGLYKDAVRRLRDAGITEAENEAAIILGTILDLNRAQLFLAGDRELAHNVIKEVEPILVRRVGREPLAYILGEQEFWSLSFRVTKDVLIPRQETEQLLEITLQDLRKRDISKPRILDLGAGSGVIPVVLAKELPEAVVYGIDRSFAALEVASFNAGRHNVLDRVRFINSDWFAGLRLEPFFDLVVTNPPYVAQEEMETLQPEVRLHEPESALDGGKQGVQAIDAISRELHHMVKPGGTFFMEIGADQAEYVLDRFQSMADYENRTVHKDYAGLPRVFQAQRRKNT